MPDIPVLLHNIFYLVFKNLFYSAFRVIWRMKVTGRENIPGSGGVIIASNHITLADPPVVGSAVGRILFFLAKEELFANPVFGWVIRNLNALPVKRGSADVGALKTSLKILNGGKGLILFPEGERRKDGFGKPRPGVAMLAQRAECPVVPAYVHNTDKMSSLRQIRVYFGRPIFFDKGSEDYQSMSEKVMGEIKQLKERYEGRH